MKIVHHICCQCQMKYWLFEHSGIFLSLLDPLFLLGDNNSVIVKNSAIVGREFLTPYFIKTHPYIVYLSLFSSFVHPLTTHTALIIAFFFLTEGWLWHIWCIILLNDIMDLHMLSLGTVVLKDFAVCFMQQDVKFTEVWQIMWLFISTQNWYHTHMHSHKDMHHIQEESAKWHAQYAHVPYVSYVPYVPMRPTCPTCPSIFYRPEN